MFVTEYSRLSSCYALSTDIFRIARLEVLSAMFDTEHSRLSGFYALSTDIFHRLIFPNRHQHNGTREIWFNILADKLLTWNLHYQVGELCLEFTYLAQWICRCITFFSVCL
jgi:hypothetical protein